MNAPPPGWYDDGSGLLRWWNGAAWTEYTAAPGPPQVASTGQGAWVPPGPASGTNPQERTPSWSVPSPQPMAAEVATRSSDGGASPPRRRVGLWIGISAAALGLVAAIVALAVAVVVPLSDVSTDAPEAAVIRWNESWNVPVSCLGAFETTTEAFRDLWGQDYADCASFTTMAADVWNDTYTVEVIQASRLGPTATVITDERWIEEGEPQSTRVEYLLVLVDGMWRIDSSWSS